MATIKDVAAFAGVSISTVSRALSGNTPVDENTRQRVLAAVDELSYKPNVLAKGLKRGRTNMIALIIPNIANPIFPAAAKGVENAARKLGYNVILCNTDENKTIEDNYINELSERWIDGFILATADDNSDHIIELKKKGVPVVLLVREMKYAIDQVVLGNYKGAYEMVKYLLLRGCSSIAIVKGRMDLSLYRDRYQGYVDALEEGGIKLDERMILNTGGGNESASYSCTYEMLKSGVRPDAIFASSDPMALGVIRAVHERGLKIPEDISVVGFDNLEMSAMMEPPLTTMSQPLYKMGYVAGTRLIELIEDKKSTCAPKTITMNSKLIIRQSAR